MACASPGELTGPAIKDLFDVEQMALDGHVVFLDVRSRREHERGHIQAKRTLHLDYFSSGFADGLLSLDKEVTYLVYCECGGRSAQVLRMMAWLGFKHVFHYPEGYSAYSVR